MQLNKSLSYIPVKTYEGAPAVQISAEKMLRRSIMSCLLWEKEFYESGETIARRIAELIPKVKPGPCYNFALEARNKMKLRHVPLLIAREMARYPEHKQLVAYLLEQIIQRPDELCEFLAIYWKDKKQPLSAKVKQGLAGAFTKFNEYQLAKYNRPGAIKLRDVLFLCHAKPMDQAQDILWKKLINNELQTPDTWEVALSTGQDKKETFTRLIKEKKLGALALLRNLRNMQEAKVESEVIKDAILTMSTERILPFRFIAAARYAPTLEAELEKAMMLCMQNIERINKRVTLLIDVSGSMDQALSEKSEMTRLDAACGLAILLREVCTDVSIFTFSEEIKPIPTRHGFALRDAICGSQYHNGTYLGQAIEYINNEKNHDILIVITDEQSHDSICPPYNLGYMINIGSCKNGIGYGQWTHIDGWSESVVSYIQEDLEEKEHKNAKVD